MHPKKAFPPSNPNIFSIKTFLEKDCAWWCLAIVALCVGPLTGTADTKLKPIQELVLGAEPERLAISQRGDFIYWLNQPAHKFQRLSLRDNRLDTRSVTLPAGTKDWCLSTDGATAYIGATANEYGTYHNGAEQQGQIQTINVNDMTATSTFSVPIDIYEMVCGEGDFLYVVPARGPNASVHKIDPRTGSVEFKFGEIHERSCLRITPDLKRLYLGMNFVSPANVSSMIIPRDDRTPAATYDSPYKNEYPLGGAFDLTPDGKHAINRAGTVLRLGTTKAADMLFVTSLVENIASVCDPASGLLWLTTEDGNLITYIYPSFELIRTENLAHPGTRIVYDAAQNNLWVAWRKKSGAAGGLDVYHVQTRALPQTETTRSGGKGTINNDVVPVGPAKLAPNQTLELGAKLIRPTISPRGDYLYWLNQSDGKLQRLSLADNRQDEHSSALVLGACDFCLSPDNSKAFIAATTNNYVPYPEKEQGEIQSIDLGEMKPSGSFAVPIDLYQIACDAENFLYANSGSGSWTKIRKIDPRRKSVVFTPGWQIPATCNLRITPDRQRLYLSTVGIGDSEWSVIKIKGGDSPVPFPFRAPGNGKHTGGGAFEITPDGNYAVNETGVIVQLSAVEAKDMIIVATVEPHLAFACDPAGSRCWVSTRDKRLLTYKYPEFELLKTELLTIYGESLAYDSAHKTLWISWAKTLHGLGGLDAYKLDSPATYPNDVTRAREPVASLTKTTAPAAPVKRTGPPGTGHQDPVVLALLIACAVIFLATIFVGWPAWSLPRPILFVGWFGWFGVLISLVAIWNLDFDLRTSRIMTAAGLVSSALLWGVLRGKKACYVIYALLMIGSFFSTVLKNGVPPVFSLFWIFVILYCGKKHWEDLV
ncbi:MAG: UbiA family prenyltransferase [Lacunisphaera sp.]